MYTKSKAHLRLAMQSITTQQEKEQAIEKRHKKNKLKNLRLRKRNTQSSIYYMIRFQRNFRKGKSNL